MGQVKYLYLACCLLSFLTCLRRTAAQQAAVSQQGGWDMSRPPPHMSTPPPHLMQPKIPSLPYFELPAGKGPWFSQCSMIIDHYRQG